MDHNIDTERFRCSCGAAMCFQCGWCSKQCLCGQAIRLAPEQAEHAHGDLRPSDLKLALFECVECGAELCLPELAEVYLLSVASE
jgi:hypothetical protein